jgi:hypothetical protein
MIMYFKHKLHQAAFGLICALLIMVFAGSGLAQRKNLIVEEGFESGGAIRDLFPGREIDGSGSFSIVNSPVRVGNRSMKVVVNGVRTEIKANGAGGSNITNGKERWFGFSLYFPNDFETTTTSRGGVDIFFQIHERPDACEDWRSPPFAVYGRDNKLEISVIHDPNPCSKGNPGNVEGKGNKKTIYSTPFIRGRWVDMVLYVKWAHDDAGNGLTEAWIDGKKVVSYKGPNCYNDQKEMYLKMGTYHHDSIVHTHYVDEIRMGNDKATYSDVVPGNSNATPEPIMTHNIKLASSWNLISLPVNPVDDDVVDVLTPINGKYAAVYGWNGEAYESYYPGDASSTLKKLVPGRGYWIFMNEKADLAVQGKAADKTITLGKSWNLVGYNSTTPMPASDALASTGGKIIVVYSFNAEANKYDAVDMFQPGYGYWMLSSDSDVKWTLP